MTLHQCTRKGLLQEPFEEGRRGCLGSRSAGTYAFAERPMSRRSRSKNEPRRSKGGWRCIVCTSLLSRIIKGTARSGPSTLLNADGAWTRCPPAFTTPSAHMPRGGRTECTSLAMVACDMHSELVVSCLCCLQEAPMDIASALYNCFFGIAWIHFYLAMANQSSAYASEEQVLASRSMNKQGITRM